MRLGELVAEAARANRARLAASIAVALLAAAMCLSSLLTVGRSAAAEDRLQDRLDTAGSRLLVVTNQRQLGLLPPAVVQLSAELDTVERAVGLTSPIDVSSGAVGPGGAPLPAWQVIGGVEQVAELTSGRWPAVGEVIVSDDARTALGLPGPYGYVVADDQDFPVVGTFRARAPFEQLGAGVVGSAAPDTSATTLHVVVGSADRAAATQAAILELVAAPQLQDLQVQSPLALASLQNQLGGDLVRFGDQILFLTLVGGSALTAAVVFVDVLVRRPDLGRRRALGATKGTIVALTMLRTALAAMVGIVVGLGVALLIAAMTGLPAPPLPFTAAIGVLALWVSVAAALIPALVAASQDPVRILRTA